MISLFKYTIPVSGMYYINHPKLFSGVYHYNSGDSLEVVKEQTKEYDAIKYILKRNNSLLTVANMLSEDGLHRTRLYNLFAVNMNQLTLVRV